MCRVQIAAMRLAAAAVSSEGGEGEATAGAAGAPEGPRPGRAMKRAKLGLRVALYGLVVEAMLNVSAWCCLLVQHCALKRARAATVVLESATESMPASVLSSFEVHCPLVFHPPLAPPSCLSFLMPCCLMLGSCALLSPLTPLCLLFPCPSSPCPKLRCGHPATRSDAGENAAPASLSPMRGSHVRSGATR